MKKLFQAGLYLTMCLIWGSSYFFITIALRGFNAPTLVSLRMLLATAALAGVALVTRTSFPREKTVWLHFLVLGLFNIALPYSLLTFALTQVNSSTASIMSSTTPLWVFLISWLIARTERFGALRAMGLLIAFLGIVAVYATNRLPTGELSAWSLVIVMCSIMYASGNVYTRRFLRGINPLMVALLQIGVGAVMLNCFNLATGRIEIGNPDIWAWLSLLQLGVVGSAFAYTLYFYFIRNWGSTATSLNTYLQPIIGLSLGVVILDEMIRPLTWLAMAVVMVGIVTFGVGTQRMSKQEEETK